MILSLWEMTWIACMNKELVRDDVNNMRVEKNKVNDVEDPFSPPFLCMLPIPKHILYM
jgi:hypothetical protein